MPDNNEKINLLLAKLETLLKRQEDFSREINSLRGEINKLASASALPQPGPKITSPEPAPTEHPAYIETEPAVPVHQPTPVRTTLSRQLGTPAAAVRKEKTDLEKFIGENLANKVGIAIVVLGIAIGAKYAIDHELISPLTRIILGYLCGIALLGFAIKLKKKYENFSAVLLSGAMAVMYFITYAAYSFYGLVPQVLTFALMVVFTAFTVVAAITYNRQVIAHIGLAGAYAVPFLLSDGSGRVAILFSYMAIINAGILVVAIRKYWKPLYYFSFALTWLIYFSWYILNYLPAKHFSLALIFLSLFFILFYLTFLSYKLLRKEKFGRGDILLLLANSFIFYGIGYSILQGDISGRQLLGLFTLANAIVHFAVSVIIFRQKLADRNLFYLVSGLVLVFITIAIPVQLDGNWVTLLWTGEAALLFWIGRTRHVRIYEKLSYPLMILAFFSILQDWGTSYGNYIPGNSETSITPLFNIHLLSSLLFVAAFWFIQRVNQNKSYTPASIKKNGITDVVNFMIPAVLIVALYASFVNEIANYFTQLYMDSLAQATGAQDNFKNNGNMNLVWFQTIWIINYSLLFVSALGYVNLRKLKNRQLGIISICLIVLTLIIFLTTGLFTLSNLRESYLEQSLAPYFHSGAFNIGIRYVSYVFAGLALIVCYKYTRADFIQVNLKLPFELLLYISLLWILSSELLNWMDITSSKDSYKLGLSIFWAIYSLSLVTLGIWKKKKYLRIGAIILFGVTLLKLFFYDIVELDTISKTIVLVCLGVVLLIISFLYNKYKYIIADDTTH